MILQQSTRILLALSLLPAAGMAAGPTVADPRLREVTYDARAVITVPIKRGVVSLVVLDPDEVITDVAAGLGGDCSKPEATWCITAQSGGRHVFVKAKSTAQAPNTLAVVTDRRTHSFRFVVLPDGDPRPPIYRLVVHAPRSRPAGAGAQSLSPQELVTQRLQAKPQIINARYSIAEGADSQDIVPTLVFDDGRFTYFRFPGNREIPSVFHVLGDGQETLVNARMDDDLLVIDRVSRRLVLRAGSAVVGIWNEAFDLDGLPPDGATTVTGVRRHLRSAVPARAESDPAEGTNR